MPGRPHRTISPTLLAASILIVGLLFVLTDLAEGGNGNEAATASAGAASGSLVPSMASEVALPPIVAVPPPAIIQREHEREEARERDRFLARERIRIRTHLVEVENELRGREPEGLTPEQRENRARHLAVLREYIYRGEFPRNLDFPGELVPVFVDDRGVHCAVGYLIHRDGRDDLVERISSTRNFASVPELADDAELLAWLEEAGLTPAEAARIQPQYCGCNPQPVEPEQLSTRYAAASLASAAVSGVSVGIHFAGDPHTSRWVAGLGTASGLAGLALGAHGISEGGDARAFGAMSAALGAASTFVGVRSFVSRPGPSPVPSIPEEGEYGRAASKAEVTLSPLLTVDRGDGSRAGFLLRVRH